MDLLHAARDGPMLVLLYFLGIRAYWLDVPCAGCQECPDFTSLSQHSDVLALNAWSSFHQACPGMDARVYCMCSAAYWSYSGSLRQDQVRQVSSATDKRS